MDEILDYEFGTYKRRPSSPEASHRAQMAHSPVIRTSTRLSMFATPTDGGDKSSVELPPLKQSKSSKMLQAVAGSKDKSLCLFSYDGFVRRTCIKVVSY